MKSRIAVIIAFVLATAGFAAAGPSRSTAPTWAAHNRPTRFHVNPTDLTESLGAQRTLEASALVDTGDVVVVDRQNVGLFSEDLLAQVTIPKASTSISVEVTFGREAHVALSTHDASCLIPLQVIGDASPATQEDVARVVSAQHLEKRGMFDVPTKIIANVKAGSVEVELGDGSKHVFDHQKILKLPVRVSVRSRVPRVFYATASA